MSMATNTMSMAKVGNGDDLAMSMAKFVNVNGGYLAATRTAEEFPALATRRGQLCRAGNRLTLISQISRTEGFYHESCFP